MSFVQNEKTKEFVKSAKSLKANGKVKNYKIIVDKLNWDATMMSHVMNGRKDVPNDVYKRFAELYLTNLISNEEIEQVDYKTKYIQFLEEENTFLKNQNAYLQNNLNTLINEILPSLTINRA